MDGQNSRGDRRIFRDRSRDVQTVGRQRNDSRRVGQETRKITSNVFRTNKPKKKTQFMITEN